jgi:hypothetical protein
MTMTMEVRSAQCRRLHRIDVVLQVDDWPRMPSRSSPSSSFSPHPPFHWSTTSTTRRRTLLLPPMKLAATTLMWSTTTAGGDRRFPAWMSRTAAEARGPWSRRRVQGGKQRRMERSSYVFTWRNRLCYPAHTGLTQHHLPTRILGLFGGKKKVPPLQTQRHNSSNNYIKMEHRNDGNFFITQQISSALRTKIARGLVTP